jgi:hypothetical protein
MPSALSQTSLPVPSISTQPGVLRMFVSFFFQANGERRLETGNWNKVTFFFVLSISSNKNPVICFDDKQSFQFSAIV